MRAAARDHAVRLRDIPSAGAGYVVALAVTLLMFTLRYQLRDVLGEFSSFLPFILGIILAAWYGGFWPGLMATVLGAGLILYFFYPLSPPSSLADAIRGVTVLVFIAIGLLTSFLCEELHAARRLLEGERARQAVAERAVRESEEHFRVMAEQLLEAERRKDEFLATLAHELRNPLAPLRNAVEVMQRTDDHADQQVEARQIVARQVRQMVRLIDDLLDVSRITRGKLELRHERVPFSTVLHDAVETSRPVLEAKRHELSIVLPDEQIDVDGDPTRLAQVFSNLLNNAAKFTEPGGRVTVSAQREGEVLVVRVRDTGIGIPSDMLPRIFDMFTQVDTGPARSQSGLGIGLTIVKRIVELHGGTVDAHSGGPGRGSEFVVRLRVAAPLPSSAVSSTQRIEPAVAASRRRVLVVDDNEDAAKSLSMFLELMEHEVRCAYDGRAALRLGAEQKPDVILLDIGLPELDGYEVAHRIRQQAWGKDVILIALTGWGQDEDRRRSREAGFDLHLTKPFDPNALEQLLRKPTLPASA